MKNRTQKESSIELWNQEINIPLIGVMVGRRVESGAYGKNEQIVIETEEGLIAFWCTRWIKENLAAKDAVEGDLIALTFKGKKTTAQGRPYNAYELIVDKGDVL